MSPSAPVAMLIYSSSILLSDESGVTLHTNFDAPLIHLDDSWKVSVAARIVSLCNTNTHVITALLIQTTPTELAVNLNHGISRPPPRPTRTRNG
jgi:hypothetical protein